MAVFRVPRCVVVARELSSRSCGRGRGRGRGCADWCVDRYRCYPDAAPVGRTGGDWDLAKERDILVWHYVYGDRPLIQATT